MAKEQIYGVKPKVKVVETNKTEVYQEYFTLVTSNKQTRIAVGNAIISRNTFDSVKAAKAYIDQKPWELMINLLCYVYDMAKKQEAEKPSNEPSK